MAGLQGGKDTGHRKRKIPPYVDSLFLEFYSMCLSLLLSICTHVLGFSFFHPILPPSQYYGSLERKVCHACKCIASGTVLAEIDGCETCGGPSYPTTLDFPVGTFEYGTQEGKRRELSGLGLQSQ
jgi:hypothetical protein